MNRSTALRRTPLRAPRRKKCRNPDCRQWFQPGNSMQKACSPDCALKIARHEMLKEARRRNQEERRSLKPLTKLCSETQVDVNRYIRLRDADKGCISCPSPEVTDAGHFFHAGSKYRTSRLRFNHSVIHGQCSSCNRFTGGGNMQGYIEGIRHRYGDEYLQDLYALKERADRGELEPLTKDEVREIAAENRRLARELKRQREASA